MPRSHTWVSTTDAISLSTHTIQILVGPEEKPFTIHEGILTTGSKFFKNAMRQGLWEEADTKTVKLPEDDPKTFALYAQLAYTGVIPSRVYHTGDSESDFCKHPKDCAKEYESPCKLYVFSEKIQDVNAKEATLSALISKINYEFLVSCNDACGDRCLPEEGAINIMYEGTTDQDKGRYVLVDSYVDVGNSTDLLPGREATAVEFFKDVAIAMLDIPRKPKKLRAANYFDGY